MRIQQWTGEAFLFDRNLSAAQRAYRHMREEGELISMFSPYSETVYAFYEFLASMRGSVMLANLGIRRSRSL